MFWLTVRFAIFGVIWVLLGKRIWFFPNILAEEASFKELLRFWPEPNKEDEKPPKWTSRLAFALVLGLVTWFCVHYAPDEAARTRFVSIRIASLPLLSFHFWSLHYYIFCLIQVSKESIKHHRWCSRVVSEIGLVWKASRGSDCSKRYKYECNIW